MTNKLSRSLNEYLLIILLLFQGISGVFGGAVLVYDPTGDTLQMPISLLDSTPFDNYLLPGLILLIVLGAFPIFITYGLWNKRRWSRMGALAVGLALIIWIGVEIAMIGYHSEPPLQAIYASVGFLILFILLVSRSDVPSEIP